LMESPHMIVEPGAPIHKLGVHLFALDRSGVAYHVQRVCHLLHDFLWRKIGSMEVNREVRQSHLIESMEHNIQRGSFFRHKQDTLSDRCEAGNQISNRLALACPGWPVHDSILARQYICYCALLA